MTFARSLKALLARYAGGDFSAAPPVRLLGAQGYFRLPPKAVGEPKIELGGLVAEMTLNLPSASSAVRRLERAVVRERRSPLL